MPFINTRTTKTITEDKELSIKTGLGEAIRALGKSEGWLMLNFEDNCRMYFKGQKGDMAMVEVSLFGSATNSQYDKMTALITDIFSKELGISPDKIYVKYEPVDTWGWNGSNF